MGISTYKKKIYAKINPIVIKVKKEEFSVLLPVKSQLSLVTWLLMFYLIPGDIL